MLGRSDRSADFTTRCRSPIPTPPAPPILLATVIQLMGEEKGFDYPKRGCTATSTNTLNRAPRRPRQRVSEKTLIGITFSTTW